MDASLSSSIAFITKFILRLNYFFGCPSCCYHSYWAALDYPMIRPSSVVGIPHTKVRSSETFEKKSVVSVSCFDFLDHSVRLSSSTRVWNVPINPILQTCVQPIDEGRSNELTRELKVTMKGAWRRTDVFSF